MMFGTCIQSQYCLGGKLICAHSRVFSIITCEMYKIALRFSYAGGIWKTHAVVVKFCCSCVAVYDILIHLLSSNFANVLFYPVRRCVTEFGWWC